jgi:hypothetical protein
LQAGITRRRYVYRISMAAYQKDWGNQYHRPGFGARFLGFLFRLMPKVGPFKALSFKVPPPAAEKLFLVSLDETMRSYRELLAAVREDRLQLVNENFDTGRPARFGDYRLADEAYAKLLDRLEATPAGISEPLRANILSFYGASGVPSSDKSRTVLTALQAR